MIINLQRISTTIGTKNHTMEMACVTKILRCFNSELILCIWGAFLLPFKHLCFDYLYTSAIGKYRRRTTQAVCDTITLEMWQLKVDCPIWQNKCDHLKCCDGCGCDWVYLLLIVWGRYEVSKDGTCKVGV